MHLKFLTGPAGSGKSYRCVAEVRERLLEAHEELPLVFLVPKQATFQIERAVLEHSGPAGFSRLHVLSFERFAHFIFEQLGKRAPTFITEEGRIMVLRSLLTQHQQSLRIFRLSSARKGFALELSKTLRELQIAQLTPEQLRRVATDLLNSSLREKLNDLAFLLEAYLQRLKAQQLVDAECLIEEAALALHTSSLKLELGGLWMDGFGSLNPQERSLLKAIIPCAEVSTLAFCTEACPDSIVGTRVWDQVNLTKERLHNELRTIEAIHIHEERLVRRTEHGRFDRSHVLAFLESAWTKPSAFQGDTGESLEIIDCHNPQEEIIAAAREILKFVKAGARFRDIAVLVRSLEPWQESVQETFKRFEIPFFMDRRENISHHPIAETTRGGFRVVTSGWRHADIFNFLKSGLGPLDEEDVDWLENECLEFWGENALWKPNWKFPTHYNHTDNKARFIELRRRINIPLERLEAAMLMSTTATSFVAGLRQFWADLQIEKRLEGWHKSEPFSSVSIHATAYSQMEIILEDMVRAFGEEKRNPSDWIQLLESGFENLTVGLIPPALDQVLVGAVDRSRNTDLKLTILIGLNEGVFPQSKSEGVLLGEQDIDQLDALGVSFGRSRKTLTQREQYLAYIAMTRSMERLVITKSRVGAAADPINPSILITRLKQLFPTLTETPFRQIDESSVDAAVHTTELTNLFIGDDEFNSWLTRERPLVPVCPTDEQITAESASVLHGAQLKTSVSRFEQYAMCPFRFFVDSGLRAHERMTYTLGKREKGSFQHAVIQEFHANVKNSGRLWRDLTSEEARAMIGRIADQQMEQFNGGLANQNTQNQLIGAACKSSLQNMVEQLVKWMSTYEFNPEEAEFRFGTSQTPGLSYKLANQKELRFSGTIDRIDFHRKPEGGHALFVIVDYKSRHLKPNKLKLREGIQQQLPAYLMMLRDFPDSQQQFGLQTLEPAGMFYISLSGVPQSEGRAKARSSEARNDYLTKAYQHQGIFNLEHKQALDNREAASVGEQFNYRLTNGGVSYASHFNALSGVEFHGMLAHLETEWKRMGDEIYQGQAAIQPYRIKKETACDRCRYGGICRIDSWSHQNYRNLKPDR